MPGLIKHMDYDTLFVGTSMGRNFLEPDANKLLHTTSFNGSLPGSTAREQNMTAQLATHSKLLKILFGSLIYIHSLENLNGYQKVLHHFNLHV